MHGSCYPLMSLQWFELVEAMSGSLEVLTVPGSIQLSSRPLPHGARDPSLVGTKFSRSLSLLAHRANSSRLVRASRLVQGDQSSSSYPQNQSIKSSHIQVLHCLKSESHLVTTPGKESRQAAHQHTQCKSHEPSFLLFLVGGRKLRLA